MQNLLDNSHISQKDDLFAEKFIKVTFRDFSNNTRMDIKNVELKANQIKRDRAINYWQNNVIQNFLPQIDSHKRTEVEKRKVSISPARIANWENHYFNFLF